MTALTTPLSPVLQAFFTDRLARQRHASPATIAGSLAEIGLDYSRADFVAQPPSEGRREAAGLDRDAPRPKGMMQKVQRWSQPFCIWT